MPGLGVLTPGTGVLICDMAFEFLNWNDPPDGVCGKGEEEAILGLSGAKRLGVLALGVLPNSPGLL